MSGTTISGSYSTGIVLNSPSTQNPVTVTGRIDTTNTSALYGTNATTWTITNNGTLIAPGFGVHLAAGGTIGNASGAIVTGGSAGVYVGQPNEGTTTITNAGTIVGVDAGISLHSYGVANGYITNTAGGTIEATGIGIRVADYGFGTAIIKPGYGPFPSVSSDTTTIFNDGVVAGTTAIAVNVPAAPGEIFLHSATVINAGTIAGSGTNGVAVQFAGTVGGVLIVEPGATFTGEINGGSAGSTIDLAAGTGTLSSFGSTIVNVTDITFDPGARWTIAGSPAGLSGVIYGFAPGDTIDLTGLQETVENYNAGTLTLTGDQTVLLNLPGPLSAASFQTAPDGETGTYIFVTGTSGTYSTPVMTIGSDFSIDAFLAGIYKSTPWIIVNYGAVEGSTGIELEKGGSVANLGNGRISGHVESGGLFYFGHYTAIDINGGGAVTNAANAVISDEVQFAGAAGTVINAGLISVYRGIMGAAVSLPAGSSLTNAASGTISGPTQGVVLGTNESNQPVTVINAGMIIGGSSGVSLQGAGTVTNAGTIASIVPGYAAVRFGGTVGGRVIVDPGAVFIGGIDGGTSGSSIELAAGGAGILTGFGIGIIGFTNIIFDAGATWTIAGTAIGLGGTMSGFASGDTIDLTGVSETVKDYNAGILTLTGSQIVELQLPGTFTTASFQATPDTGTGTDILLACFAAGTRIATDRGSIAVEHLRVGDHALTLASDGELKPCPIRWIGRRRIDLVRHPRPDHARPIRIRRSAFADKTPNRDLLLSRDHAIYAKGVLIPIRCLVNNRTVTPARHVRHIEYFHIELGQHAILLAENMPVESYLDTGDRLSFEGGGIATALHPDFAARGWEAAGCAPLVVTGSAVQAVQHHLLRRAMQDRPKTRAA